MKYIISNDEEKFSCNVSNNRELLSLIVNKVLTDFDVNSALNTLEDVIGVKILCIDNCIEL